MLLPRQSRDASRRHCAARWARYPLDANPDYTRIVNEGQYQRRALLDEAAGKARRSYKQQIDPAKVMPSVRDRAHAGADPPVDSRLMREIFGLILPLVGW